MHADQHDTHQSDTERGDEALDSALDQALDQALDRALQSLPADLLPTRDLWPALEERLVGLPQSGRNRKVVRGWHAWAAAAAAVLAALWFMPSAQSPLPPQPPLSQEAMTAEMMLIQTYEQQKAQQLAALAPTAVDSWAPYLGVLDAAVAQVRYALSFYPEEPGLLKQLDRLYRQELLYLQEVALTDTTAGVFYPGATP